MPEEPIKETQSSEAPELSSAGTAFRQSEGNDNEPFPYFVQIGDVYDGPLDLLLTLIKKQNFDIWNLPISKITAQFLAYVKTIPAEEADSAAEFFYMASQLIVIKSRMLLPIERAAAENGAADDPRTSLIERLLEYEQVKRCSPRDKRQSRRHGPDRMPTPSGTALCAAELHRRSPPMRPTSPVSSGRYSNAQQIGLPLTSPTMPSWSVRWSNISATGLRSKMPRFLSKRRLAGQFTADCHGGYSRSARDGPTRGGAFCGRMRNGQHPHQKESGIPAGHGCKDVARRMTLERARLHCLSMWTTLSCTYVHILGFEAQWVCPRFKHGEANFVRDLTDLPHFRCRLEGDSTGLVGWRHEPTC
jgi:hypothetical protein